MTFLSVSSFAFTLGILHQLCHLSRGNHVLPAQGRARGPTLQGCLLQLEEQLQQPSSPLAESEKGPSTCCQLGSGSLGVSVRPLGMLYKKGF